MTSLDATASGIQQVIDAGFKPVIRFVYRDPVDAWYNGVLARAESGGHITPKQVFANAHATARKNLDALVTRFGDQVRVEVFETRNEQAPEQISLEELRAKPQLSKEQILEAIDDGTDRATEEGSGGSRPKGDGDNSEGGPRGKGEATGEGSRTEKGDPGQGRAAAAPEVVESSKKDIEDLRPLAKELWAIQHRVDAEVAAEPSTERYALEAVTHNSINAILGHFGIERDPWSRKNIARIREALEPYGVTDTALLVQLRDMFPEYAKPEDKSYKAMTRDEFIAAHRRQFMREQGKRRLLLVSSDGVASWSVKDQINGRLTRPADDILGEIWDKFVARERKGAQSHIEEGPAIRVTGTPDPEVAKAIEKVQAKAAEWGVLIDSIDIVDEEHILTWEHDQKGLERAGITKEMYDDAVSHGKKFSVFGTHERVVRPGGRIGACIALFRDHNSRTLYHEFGHALHVQGRIRAPEGADPEQVADYVARLFLEGREEELVREPDGISTEDLWGGAQSQTGEESGPSDPTIDVPSAQGGFVGGRPGAARASISAIVREMGLTERGRSE